MEAKYQVLLLDKDGYHITNPFEADTLKAAKERAKYLLSDEWATTAETTHETLGTKKVEIRNQAGECVWDDFLAAKGGAL